MPIRASDGNTIRRKASSAFSSPHGKEVLAVYTGFARPHRIQLPGVVVPGTKTYKATVAEKDRCRSR